MKRLLASAAAVALLAACQLTGNPTADLNAFATEVSAFNQQAASNVAGLATGTIVASKAVAQTICGAGNELHGLFAAYTPVMAVAAVDPKVMATEAASFAGLQIACAIVDKADPATPAATIASATAQAVAAYVQIKGALQTGAPDAAAVALAPAAAPTS